MNKLVYSVFKAIMISIIVIFVFDMASYLYRAVSLNTRMESLSTSLKKVVMENNYLPPEDSTLYANILGQMVVDFNHADSYSVSPNSGLVITDSDANDDFISGLHWNYGSSALDKDGNAMSNSSDGLLGLKGDIYEYNASNWTKSERRIVETDMSKPREYGDIQVVQIRVGIYQPLWNWGNRQDTTTAGTDYNYSGQDANSFDRANIRSRGTTFTYTYYVPCLKYKSTNLY